MVSHFMLYCGKNGVLSGFSVASGSPGGAELGQICTTASENQCACASSCVSKSVGTAKDCKNIIKK